MMSCPDECSQRESADAKELEETTSFTQQSQRPSDNLSEVKYEVSMPIIEINRVIMFQHYRG